MNKSVMIGIVVVVIVLGGGALYMLNSQKPTMSKTGGNDMTSPMPVNTGQAMEALPTGTGAVKEFTIEGSSFKFVPAEMKVKKGDTVKVTFKNSGGMHDFVIDEFNVKTEKINEGEEEELEFVADKVGTFEYYCSVGTHRQMGMVGKLIVE